MKFGPNVLVTLVIHGFEVLFRVGNLIPDSAISVFSCADSKACNFYLAVLPKVFLLLSVPSTEEG